MSFPKVKIGDIAEINPRIPKDTDETQEVSFLGMASVSEDGKLLKEEFRTLAETRKGFTFFTNEDVLLAKITPCFENGKSLHAGQLSNPIGFGSTEFHVIRANPRHLDATYLFYMVWSQDFRFYGQKAMSGAAGQKRISANFVRDYEIPLPPLPEQQRIAAILDKADAIRRKRQQAIQLADEFLRSVFLEMFGDPVTNPKGVDVVTLADVTTRITDGVHQKPNYTDSGVPFISVKDITTGDLKFDNCKFISIEDHNKFTKRCKPEKLDILYTKVGATYGRPALINTDIDFSIYVSVCLIKIKKDLINPYFLMAILGSSAIKNQADKRIKGIGVPDLHLDQIRQFLIPLPSMKLQDHFMRRVQKVEGLKAKLKASQAQAEAQFNALSQRAFAGEL